ncbi:MAG TPA: condensation domain-containing protein, partial [Ktedonobacteraceae bacterium]|nr:condensation domain-containing protein [Ktedonobacteraceae bacterium]
ADTQRSFDLTVEPLFRTALLRLSDDEHILLLTIHHIIFDGWSQTILLNELNLLYDAFRLGAVSPLPDLPVQYADFALWQRSWWRGEVRENQLRYWVEQLRGWHTLDLPTDYPRPTEISDQGATWFFSLPPQLAIALRTVSRREGVSLFMTLLGGFQVMLGRYSRQRDVLVGTDIANRTVVESEGLLGFFVNILPLRLRWKGTESFHSILQQLREGVFGAYAHQDLPFDQLIEALHLERTLNRQPLVNVLFVWQNLPTVSARAQDVIISPLTMGVNSAKFDLALFMWEEAGQLKGGINYSTALFRETTIERLSMHFLSLLKAISEDTEKSIDALNMHTHAEQEEKEEQEGRFHETQRRKLKVTKRSIIPL